MSDRRATLEQIVKEALPPGQRRILVAVSGGVDSVVLLHLLANLRAECGLELAVAHLDHRLRRESSADAAFVARLAERLGLPCSVGTADVRALAARRRISLEMAAREARRAFLEQAADERGAGLIALAHHRDDQAETFLLRLVRGSGQSGLACMKRCDGRWWRPLLGVGRRRILSRARAAGLAWVEDASNDDSIFRRNLIRNRVAPLLNQINPRFSRTVAETAGRIQLEEAYWRQQVDALMARSLLSSGDGLRLDRSVLLAAHPALRLRLYRFALTLVRGGIEGIGAVHLHDIDGLLTGARSQAQIDLPEAWAARRYQCLWLRSGAPQIEPFAETELPVPGELALPDGRRLKASLGDAAGRQTDSAVAFALDRVELPLRVRSWRPGDRFVPSGMTGHKKLKRFFSDSRVETEDRARALVLTSGKAILWIVGRRRSAAAPVRSDSSKILRLELLPGGKKEDK